MAIRGWVGGLFAAVWAGCGAPQGTAPEEPTWHGAVRPILDRSCVSCHDASGGPSGISLASYADARTWREAIGVAVAEGTMPPWLAEDGCTDYLDDYSLSPGARETLLAWVDAGAPEGDPATAAPPTVPWTPPVLDRVDYAAEMPVPYTPAASPDDYRCFLLDWPYDEPVWVTGYNVAPGNTDIVHHVIPFIMPPDDVADFRALDDADPGEGYACYGGPGGDVETLISARWLGAWAPGTGASRLPEGYGIEVAPGSVIAFQVHYNTATRSPAPDQSALELQIETTPQDWAAIQPFADPRWVLGVGMDIPANTQGVEHSFAYVNDDGLGPIRLHSGLMHMHTLGRSGRIEVEHPDGSRSCVLSMPRYSFDWQRTYTLATPVPVEENATLDVSCVWDNPTDLDVSWGDGTGDEMCLGLVLMTR